MSHHGHPLCSDVDGFWSDISVHQAVVVQCDDASQDACCVVGFEGLADSAYESAVCIWEAC